MNGLKRFFKNKNVVTVIAVVAIVGILAFAYNSQINSQVEPISIPVAVKLINPGEKITSDMVEVIQVPKVGVSSNVIRYSNLIIGQYSDYNTVIPAGSMFYTETVVDGDSLPNMMFDQVKEGDVPYNFNVSESTTYGNSMFPGTYIDLYMKAENDAGQVMIAKLVSNVEIISVKTSDGENVFNDTDSKSTPSFMLFGVDPEIHILLKKAEYMSEYGVVIFPVPHGSTPDDEAVGATTVSSTILEDFINSKTVVIPVEDEQIVVDTTEETVVTE